MRHTMLTFLLALAPCLAGAQEPDAPRRDTLLDARALPREVAQEVTEVFNAAGTLRATGRLEIAADSVVAGDVAVLHGPLTIAGRVTGKVVAINADLVLRPGARLDGDVLIVGGTITGKEDAVIGGDLRIYQQPLAYRRDGERLTVRPPREDDDDRWWSRRRSRQHYGWSNIRFASTHTYNRVEGLPIEVGPSIGASAPWGRASVSAYGIFRTGGFDWTPQNLGHDVKAELRLGRLEGIAVGGRLFDVVEPVERWQLTDPEVGLASFFLHRDYRDYYDRHGGSGHVAAYFGRDVDLTVALSDERWGARREQDPFTLFRNAQAWRPNPLLDEGRLHRTTTTLRVDTRNNRRDPWSGWYVVADYERGTGEISRLGPRTVGSVPAPGRTTYDRGFIDLRRYNRISPDGQLNLRVVAGGWLGGDDLPLQRRLSVGGPGTLPGFDFRRVTGTTDVGTCSGDALGGGVPPGIPAQCERVALAQVEYRGDLRFDLLGAVEDRDWHGGLEGHAVWVLFADAGRGWLVGTRRGDLQYPAGTLPPLGTFRTDVGAGLELDFLGLYIAKAVSESGEPLNFFVRLRRRF